MKKVSKIYKSLEGKKVVAITITLSADTYI